jgi:hypothetical protein
MPLFWLALSLLLVSGPVQAAGPSCAKQFSIFLRSPHSAEGRQWLTAFDEFLNRNGKALERAGVKVGSAGRNKLRVRIPAEGYDEIVHLESGLDLHSLFYQPETIARAWRELPAVERKLKAGGLPLDESGRYWAFDELRLEEDLLARVNRGPGARPLLESLAKIETNTFAASVPKAAQAKVRELQAILKRPGSMEEFLVREQKELHELRQISTYANEHWLKFPATRVQDLNSERLARFRLALELERLLQDGRVVIEEVYETGARFNDKFSPGPDQIRAFSENLPVFRVRVKPGKDLELSRSWGGKSGEFSSWLLPREDTYIHPGLLRENTATPSVNTHQFRTDFRFGEGEVFYLGGINPVRGEGPELSRMAGDFDYGLGGRGGRVQYWREPSMPRLTEQNVIGRRTRIVTSESLADLQQRIQAAPSLKVLEDQYESFLRQAEARFLGPDLDTAAAIRDVPEGFLRSFLHDLKTLEAAARESASKLGGEIDPGLVKRAKDLQKTTTETFITYHGSLGVRKEYDPVKDSLVPLNYYDALRVSDFPPGR